MKAPEEQAARVLSRHGARETNPRLRARPEVISRMKAELPTICDGPFPGGSVPIEEDPYLPHLWELRTDESLTVCSRWGSPPVTVPLLRQANDILNVWSKQIPLRAERKG